MSAPESHPWSRGFSWTDHVGTPSTLDAAQVAAFDREGYLVLPELLPADLLAEAVAEADGFDAETEALLATREGGRISIAEAGALTFSVHLAARSAVMSRVVSHPNLLGVVADLVGPDVRLYWDQAVYKKPEKPRRFPWHQDNGYGFVEPQQYLTVWLALTDATSDNGCPQIVPGLHRGGTLRHRYVDPLGWECLSEPEGTLAAPVPAGGAVVFSSLTPHLTGPNLTDGVRKAYIVQYAPDGAEKLEGDWQTGPPTGRTRCDDPTRQPVVLRNGSPVPAAGAPVADGP